MKIEIFGGQIKLTDDYGREFSLSRKELAEVNKKACLLTEEEVKRLRGIFEFFNHTSRRDVRHNEYSEEEYKKDLEVINKVLEELGILGRKIL